ncbi:MAG: DUF296 domain-containing protein [Methanomicrobiaceae archaeon]|nr:DUF296 domain-containing protein [Methanomicrobiaceae archaeon]
MQYSEGRIGRIFTVRIDDGEDFLEEIRRFVAAMDVQAGMIQFLGALREGRMVTGPKTPVIPPVPHPEDFSGGWEILGLATIYPGEDGPSIHLHASAGRGERALTGCLREKAEIYLVVEAIVTEFVGLAARRAPDENTGLHLPAFANRPE